MVLKKTIFYFFFLLLWLCIIFSIVGIDTKRLNGDYDLPRKPDFEWKAFWTAEYQDGVAEYLRTHNPLYNELIRIDNQYQYWAFHMLPPGGTIIGKENYLYEKGRIRAVHGEDYMGETGYKYYKELFDFVADTLTKLHKPMLYVIAGEKTRVLPEFLPDKDQQNWPDTTNYNLYLKRFSKQDKMLIIDMAAYFLQIKDTSKVELYPKYSVHWSIYSVYLAMDSITKSVNKLLPVYEAAVPYLKGFEESRKKKALEYDLMEFLNLYFGFYKPMNHYPIVEFKKQTQRKKPRMMVIGDSFGEMTSDLGYIYEAFDDSSIFLRYNVEYKTKGNNKLINVNKLDYWREFAKADGIVFISSELNLTNYGFGFFEKAYDHFHGITNLFDNYNTQSVVRTIEDNDYVFTIKKGSSYGTYLKNTNFPVEPNHTYRLHYKARGKGMLQTNFYPGIANAFDTPELTPDWKEYSADLVIPNYDGAPVMFRFLYDYQSVLENEIQLTGFRLEQIK